MRVLLPAVVLFALLLFVGTVLKGGRLYCEEPAIDLHLPSEDAISKDQPARSWKDDDQIWRFRYAPTGTEGRAGIPYWIFRVMPRIFADKLGGRGYAWFGFHDDDQSYYTHRAGDSADGKSFKMPRGTVLVDTDFEVPLFHFKLVLKRVALNCSACHRGEVMVGSKRVLVDGMPNGVADLQGFKRFFQRQIEDDAFNAPRVLQEIDAVLAEEGKPALTARDRDAYQAIVWIMKKLSSDNAGKWMDARPENGPGRIDPFNAVKFEVLKVPDDGTAATLDFPSLWNQRKEIRQWHHYDGNTEDSSARNYGSVVGVGGMSVTIHKQSVDQVGNWIDGLEPPDWPFGAQRGDVAKGQAIFDKMCFGCHGRYDPKTRTVVKSDGYQEPHPNVGTDPERYKAFPAQAAALLNDFGERRQLWPAGAFRGAQDGYISGPLDGLWARAPYLHNGSVPTLDDLLRPPSERPKRFCRGSNEYDPVKVGFVSKLDGCARPMMVYDTALKGNSNAGHAFVPASASDRENLIAYLRSL